MAQLDSNQEMGKEENRPGGADMSLEVPEPYVDADTVNLTNCNPSEVTADHVEMNQSSAGKVVAGQVNLTQGAIGLVKTKSAIISDSGVGAVAGTEAAL